MGCLQGFLSLKLCSLTPEPLQLLWGGGWCMAGEQTEAVTATSISADVALRVEGWALQFVGLPSGCSLCVGQVQGITFETQCKKKYYQDLKGWHQIFRSLETLLCFLIAIVNIYTVSFESKKRKEKRNLDDAISATRNIQYNTLCIHQHKFYVTIISSPLHIKGNQEARGHRQFPLLCNEFPTLEARQWQQWVHAFPTPEQAFFLSCSCSHHANTSWDHQLFSHNFGREVVEGE